MRGFLYFCLGFLLLSLAVFAVAGKRGSMSRKPPIELIPDMDRQPKIRPQEPNAFFADGRGSRLPVEGTVARGSNWQDIPLNTGRESGSTNFVAANPLPVNELVMARGRERFGISCAICHGPTADGNGVTKKFGMAIVANLHDRRIVEMSDGELFSVITHGRNNMGPYGDKLTPEDRWAVIYYLRSLQLARLGYPEDLTPAQRQNLR